MRILAVDYGDAHTGVSISDPTGFLASQSFTIHLHNRQMVAERVIETAKENECGEIVVGHPLNMNGTLGERALKCEEFAHLLEEIGERVSTMPEYLGSLRSLADVIKVTSNLQEPVRCDLSCVCLNVIDDRFRVRVHHLRGVAHA